MVALGRDDGTHELLALTMRLVRAVDAPAPINEALAAMCSVLRVDRANYYTRNLADHTLALTHSTAQIILDTRIAPLHYENDASIAAQTLQSGRPIICAPFPSPPDDEQALRSWGLPPMRNIASLPIIIGGSAHGVLQLINVPPDVLTGDMLSLTGVAILFGAVLESANRRQELATLGDTILQVNRSLELQDTFDAVLNGLVALVPSISTAIYLDGLAPDMLVRVAVHVLGDGEQYPTSQPRPLTGSLVGWVYTHRTSVNVPDLRRDPRVLRSGPDALPPDTEICSYIMVPMSVQGQPVGVLACARRGVGAFTDHDVEVVERFAPLAAQAVANARSYEEAKHGRKRMETLLEDIADAAIRIGRDRRVIGWNRGAERLLGYTADEIIGQFPPGDPIDRDLRLYQRVLAGESFVNLDNRQQHKDGHYLDTIISFSPLRERGEIIGAVAFVRDITPLKQLQTQLRAEININVRRAQDEAYIAAVAQACNSAANGPAILQALAALTANWADSASVITFVNRIGSLAAYASKTPKEDAPIIPHLHAYVDVLTNFLFRDGQGGIAKPDTLDIFALTGDLPIITASRARGYHTYAYAPIFAGGEIVGALGAAARGTTAPFDAQALETLRLVAEQAGLAITKDRLLKQVEAQVQALEQASRHKDDFLASLSHELRTPLNAILGFGQMLADEQLTDPVDVQQAVDDIIVSGRLLLAQVNDLLDMARIEAGQMTVEWADVPLAPLLHACERVVAPLMAAKRQHFTLYFPEGNSLPPVRADAERLRQVLLNLLTNAYKFTPENGCITVTVTVAQQGTHVALVVRDTGIGIAPEHAKIVFEPFRRVETGYARKQGGTGLGLALCRRFVGLMGGTLALESVPNIGSTFTIVLPIAISSQEKAMSKTVISAAIAASH